MGAIVRRIDPQTGQQRLDSSVWIAAEEDLPAPAAAPTADSDSLRNILAHTRGLRTEAIRYRLLRLRVPVRGQRRKPDRSKSGVHAKKSTTGLSDRFSFDAGEAVARVAKCVDRAGEGTDGERRKGQRAQIV